MTRHSSAFLLAAMMLGALCSEALAAPTKVSAVVGKVEHRASQKSRWAKTKLGVQLDAGAQLRTARKSRVELRFPDGSTFRLGPESFITITRTSPANAKMSKGSVFSRIIKGSMVKVEGKYGAAAVRGTEFQYDIGETTETLRTYDGTVEYTPNGGETVEVFGGRGTWVKEGLDRPARPQPVAPKQFAGGKLSPGWRQLRSGVDMKATGGTPTERAELQDQAPHRQDRLKFIPGPGRVPRGALVVDITQAGATHASSAIAGGLSEALGMAALSAAGDSTQNAVERQIGGWLYGPYAALGAYGMVGEGGSFGGARAKASAVVKDVYVQASTRFSARSGEDADWLLDETFAAFREDDVDLRAGRIRLIEGPVNNSDIGSLLPFTTVDGARASAWLAPELNFTYAWMDDYDSVTSRDLTGHYGRLQYYAKGGWIGAGALSQNGADVGITGQFAIPVVEDTVDFYGEVGDDPAGNHIETFGLYFPGLYYDNDLSLHLERASQSGYDTLTSLHAYWEWEEGKWLLATFDDSRLEGSRIAAGVLVTFEGL